MKPYSIIPHTADVRLKIEAPNFEKLFINALEGMNRIILPDYEKGLNKNTIKKTISLSSSGEITLLIDFLSEVLTLSHVNKAIFHKVVFKNIENNSLDAELMGARVDFFAEDIKAVTYHEAEVKQNDSGKYEATIIFDI